MNYRLISGREHLLDGHKETICDWMLPLTNRADTESNCSVWGGYAGRTRDDLRKGKRADVQNVEGVDLTGRGERT